MISNVNSQSFGMQRPSGSNVSSKPAVDQTSLPTDGVQLSGGEQPAAAGEVPAKATVRLEITVAELATQGLRQTLAALASAGVPVEVVVVTEKALTSTPPATPQTTTQPSVDLNNSQGYIAQPPAQPVFSRAPLAAAPHRTPSYGSD